MNERLKERIAEEWAMLDPIDPLRKLLSDVIDALTQPESVAWEQFYPDIGKPQPEQKPVATMKMLHTYGDTTPPKRPWVGLTDEDWEPLYDKFAKHQEYGAFVSGWDNFTRAIEAKLKELNI